MNTFKPLQIERLTSVLSRTGLSRSTVYSRVADGLFVPPIPLGGRAVGWPSCEVDAIVKAMIAGQPPEALKELVINLVDSRQQAA